MRTMQTQLSRTDGRRSQEGGFALILAILSLLLLTFLGLTLAATTTTELQIAANQRWGQQARYNAEAGLQAAQVILRDIAAQDGGSLAQAMHQIHLPPYNTGWTDVGAPTLPPPPAPRPGPATDQWGVAARQWENYLCSAHNGRAGYGNVLADASGNTLFQNVTTLFGRNLNGSVTIWVRRPVVPSESGQLNYDPSPGRVVVTAEGTAPYFGDVTQGANLRRRQQAVRVMETIMSINLPDEPCDLGESGQEGLGADGANFARCTPVGGFMGNADQGGS